MRHLNGLGTRPKRKPITTRKMRHIGKASIYYDEVRANGFTQVDVIRSTHNVEAVEASFYEYLEQRLSGR